MKSKRLIIIYIPILIVVAGFFIGTVILSGENVQKGMEEIPYNKKWDQVMAQSINKKDIHLTVNGYVVENETSKLYMSENMELMIPSKTVIETFDCAQNLHQKKELVIERGSNKAVMQVGTDALKFNDNEYQLPDTVQRKKEDIYVPVSLFSEYLGYKYQWDSVSNTATLTNASSTDSFLPERYSYIEEKRCVGPKNQGRYGTCWAFATLTALETSLMPEESLDFSEDNLVHNNELSEGIQDGGDYIMSMAYLMAWRGPVLEKDDPYGDHQSSSLQAVKHVQEAVIIPKKDYATIKEMVFKYGGVESSMYMSMNSSSSHSIYYNSQESAYCYKGTNKPNHDIVIVGWDDNYPKEKFPSGQVTRDGAFICLNSWGDDFGDNGVFYISYEDSRIGQNNVCYTKIEDIDNYTNIYQSDLCGWTGSMGFEGKTHAYFANVYTGEKNEKLQAVGFYSTTDDLDYEVFICENYQDKSTLNERNHLAASGTIKNKGYYTIKLDKDYQVRKNKKFAVIIKINTKGKNKRYKIIPVEMEMDEADAPVDLTDGEGYFSSEGYHWQSSEKQNCNICLKAYTKS